VLTSDTLVCASRHGGDAASPPPLNDSREIGVDIVFILIIAGLYAVSHWIARAISRLGGGP